MSGVGYLDKSFKACKGGFFYNFLGFKLLEGEQVEDDFCDAPDKLTCG